MTNIVQVPRQPAVFIPHGAGPCFWMAFPPPIGAHGFDGLKTYLSGLLGILPARPKAILVISGHWEEKLPTVSTSAAPPMLFDYYGFPQHVYQLSYPAPGDTAIGNRVYEMLSAAGIEAARNTKRGFDHGVFVPFLMVDPEAAIPVVMLSLQQDFDPSLHINIGKAIAPLRDEGVLIVGSGNSFHNLRTFMDGDANAAAVFDEWLNQAIVGVASETRNAHLSQWAEAPCARACQPREDHLLPLMVVAGAALDDVGRCDFHEAIGGKIISGFAFG